MLSKRSANTAQSKGFGSPYAVSRNVTLGAEVAMIQYLRNNKKKTVGSQTADRLS